MRIPSIGVLMVVVLSLIGCEDPRAAGAPSSETAIGSGEASSSRSRPFKRSGNLILTDTFDVLAEWQGDELVLLLASDLADETKLVVSVSRYYQEQGSSERYPVDYFSEHSTIGDWRHSRRVRLDDGAWKREIEQRQRVLSAVGEPFTVSRIADSIEISFVVPVNQDPPFEQWNANLRGRVVKQSRDLQIVEDEIILYLPIDVAMPSPGSRR